MNNELVKKLTGKNKNDYEFAAKKIINESDTKSFQDLLSQSDFLFDFIKDNVAERLFNAVNVANYLNLIPFLRFYSEDYEDFIVNALVKFADEDLTDKMLELLENGTDEEKAYAAKYFSKINDTLSVELLRKYAYSEFAPLALNASIALSAMKDVEAYNMALEKIKSNDEFEKLSAVSFLVTYNDLGSVNVLFDTMKKSAMPENVASQISYLQSFLDFLDTDFKYDTLLAVNHIINGLGEIVSISQIFDFQLYEVMEKLIELQKQEKNGKIAVVLLSAKQKFDQLTENDEYLYDENKETKNEIFEIKKLLNKQIPLFWNLQKDLVLPELSELSDFVYFAFDIVEDLAIVTAAPNIIDIINNTDNQTLILRALEVLKSLNCINKVNKNEILEKLSDSNIKTAAEQLFV
jgi:hypothetical protein